MTENSNHSIGEQDPELRPEERHGGVDHEALNPAQFQAVTHGQGPVLVIAGAGSGKTRTLVYRVAHLIEQGVAPESILLLTFTRRSAQEMLWRASCLADQSCRLVTGGTFHAVANMLLRRYGHYLGYGSGFTIIDRGDAEGIVNLLKSSLGLSGPGKQFPSKRVIINIISGAINRAMPLEELVYAQYEHLAGFIDEFEQLRNHYARFKVDHGLMDYDDLLVNWKRLLTESDEALEAISGRFQYVLVDEYQDTNPIQAEIVRLLAHGHDNVMAVGDDAQSIYSFRGADFFNIMRFPDVFPGTRIIKLEQNYRSTQPILEFTNSIIAQAEEKFTKTLFSEIESDEKPLVYSARNEGAEAEFVVDTIERLCREGRALGEIAVLFRSGFHSYKLEMELTRRAVDYVKRGGLKLTESAHIKDALSFLRVIINPYDNLAINRILLHLDRVGPKTAQKITAAIGRDPDPLAALARYPAAKTWKKGFTRLVRLLERLRDQKLTPGACFDIILEYYEPIFEKLYHDDYPKRRKDLEQVRILINGYDDLQSFVDDTALDPPEAAGDEPTDEAACLVLSTVHSAKGLEWDTVFVIGLAEGRFPHASAGFGEQWEEERRLLYVAATRARRKLYLTYPRELMSMDRKWHRTMMSPFLREINPGTYERRETETAGQARAAGSGVDGLRQRSGTKKKGRVSKKFAVDERVHHPFFGRGRVREIIDPRRIEVAFDSHGDKILHLDYARLTRCE